MTDLRQAAQAALEALEAELHPGWHCNSYHPLLMEATEYLRAALAEPQPKPIGVDGLPKNILAKPQDYASTQPEPVASTNARTQFEHFFAESRKGKGPSRRPTFAQLQDGTYVEDSTQRHWWTWQNAAPQAQQPLTDEQIANFRAGYQSGRIGTFVGLVRTIEAALGVGVKP